MAQVYNCAEHYRVAALVYHMAQLHNCAEDYARMELLVPVTVDVCWEQIIHSRYCD